jgi:hypothetical protein
VGQAVSCSVVAHNASGDSAPAISEPIVPLAADGGGAGGGGGHGGGGPGGSGGNVKPPGFSKLFVSPTRIVVFVKGARQVTQGTMVHFNLDKAAGVLVFVQRRLTGRVNGKACVALSKHNRKAKPCTRYLKVGSIAVNNAKSGANQLRYAALAGKHPLAVGSYRLFGAAANSGGWSASRSATFTVVRRKVKRLPRTT